MSKFKIGDAVKVISNRKGGIRMVGEICWICPIHKSYAIRPFEHPPIDEINPNSGSPYYCDTKGEYGEAGIVISNWDYDEDELEFARCKNTRLARKMYPDAKISECGEYIYV